MLIRPLLLALAGTVFTAATCVTSFEQQGQTGPWTGEFQHLKSFDANYFEWRSRVTDANGNEVGAVTMNICPHHIPAGGSGAFEMSVRQATGAQLTASVPSIDGFLGDGSFAHTGLSAEVTGVDPPGAVSVRVSNRTTDLAFSEVVVCGIAREADVSGPYPIVPGNVLSVSPKASIPLVLPGQSVDVNLLFTRQMGIPALIELSVAGASYAVQELRPDGSTVIDTGPFDMTLPPGWRYVPLQGIDSFVGIEGGDIQASFDFGIYSDPLVFEPFGGKKYEEDPLYVVSDELIDRRPARVVRPSLGATGIVAVNILVLEGSQPFGLRTSLTLFADDVAPEDVATLLDVYRNVDFE